MTMGPDGFQTSDVYLRTAISIDPKGWAKFDYVKMPEYRWGILLAPRQEDRLVGRQVAVDLQPEVDLVPHRLADGAHDGDTILDHLGGGLLLKAPEHGRGAQRGKALGHLLAGALGNLVENAIRHHNSAEQIRVTTSRIRDEVQLRVIDAGPGIPLPAREHAFQPIQRQTDLGGDSVGLGLAVARGLTEAMGGTLTADDTPGGGLTMVVALPAGSST